jgi:parallel beta-helix repeat protein
MVYIAGKATACRSSATTSVAIAMVFILNLSPVLSSGGIFPRIMSGTGCILCFPMMMRTSPNIFRQNGAGVAVMFTRRVKMFNNFFEDNWGDAAYGLLLKEISDSYILHNTFKGNTSGIYMEGTNRIELEENSFINNGWGMKIQASCMDNVIRRIIFYPTLLM